MLFEQSGIARNEDIQKGDAECGIGHADFSCLLGEREPIQLDKEEKHQANSENRPNRVTVGKL